jgi:hypothetical protein
VAEIQQLRTLMATPNHANAFLMQQHACATQCVSSAPRPRSHYCGLHSWNNDHNGTECRGMARDSRYTDAMRTATTHVGTGGNPKVGVPVDYTRPPPHTFFPHASPNYCPVSIPSLSQDSSDKLAQTPYEDNSVRASPASTRNMSEGHNASLVRELAGALSVLPVTPALPICPAQTGCRVSSVPVLSPLSRKTRHRSPKTRQLTSLTDTPNSKPLIVTPNRVTWSVPLVSLSVAPSFPLARVFQVNAFLQHRLRRDPYPKPSLSFRFSHHNAFSVLESDSDSDSESDSVCTLVSYNDTSTLPSSDIPSDSSSNVLHCRVLASDPSPFAALEAPPVLNPVFRVTYDAQGLPVTTPLPFSAHLPSTTVLSATSVGVSVLLPSSPLIADTGCTGLLLQLSNLPCLQPFFAPHPLPLVPFTLPDGSSLSAGGPSHITGSLTFPHKRDPVACYFLPPSDLSHSLFGVSPLIRPSGHAIFTPSTCSFYDSPSSITPFLTGTKTFSSDLWFLSLRSIASNLFPIPISTSCPCCSLLASVSVCRAFCRLLASLFWFPLSVYLYSCSFQRLD